MEELQWVVNIDQDGDYDRRSSSYRSTAQDLGETLGEIAVALTRERGPLHLIVFAHGGLNDEASGVLTNQGFQHRMVDQMRPGNGGRARLVSVLWENGLSDVLPHLASNSRFAALVREAGRRIMAGDRPPLLQARFLEAQPLVRPQGHGARLRRPTLYAASVGDHRRLVRPLGVVSSPVVTAGAATVTAVTELFPAPSSPLCHDLARALLQEIPSDPINRFIVEEFERQREPGAAPGLDDVRSELDAARVGYLGGLTAPFSAADSVANLASWLQGALDHIVATVGPVGTGAHAEVGRTALEWQRRVTTELMKVLGLAALASEVWDVIKGMSQRTFSGARSVGGQPGDDLSSLMPGRRLLGGLLDLKKAHRDRLKLSLVGHSAGTILLGHLLEAAATLGRERSLEGPVFEHVVFLAAAITYTDFENHVLTQQPLFRHFLALGLEDEYEQNSGEFLSGLYPATLLYVISEILDEGEQLVGMQAAIADPSRHTAAKRYLASRVIWTPEPGISE